MGLVDLIRNLDRREKSDLLGGDAAEIIRYSFVERDFDVLESSILDEAVALHKGVDLVNKTNLRKKLIDAIPKSELENLGFSSDVYGEAIKKYNSDLNDFFDDFKIEDTYRRINLIDNRSNFEYSTPVYGESNGTDAFPHPYQLRLKKKLAAEINAVNNYNSKKILVTMPTGAGKTVLAMEVIVDLFRNHNQEKSLNIAWIVNSKELAEQSLISFQKKWKQKGDRPVMAQRYFDKFNELNTVNDNKITFATFQLLTPRIINNEKADLNFLKNLDYLFIDEAHFTGAAEYQKVFRKYKDASENPIIVGLTATPLRANDDEFRSLKKMFNHYLSLVDKNNNQPQSPIEYLINKRYLSNVSYQVINESSSHNLKNNDKSGYYKSLHENVERVCKNIIARKENTIIFAESKSHSIALSLYLKSKKIQNELIVGETPIAKRKKYLEQLEDKENSLSIIVNERILTTGIDVKRLNSIIILANIESVTSALQVIGRAMRGPKNGGNESNIIYLTRDNRSKLERYKILEKKALNN